MSNDELGLEAQVASYVHDRSRTYRRPVTQQRKVKPMGNKMIERRASRTAVEAVIADVIATFVPEGDDGQDRLVNLDRADSIIEALGAAGYRVTRL